MSKGCFHPKFCRASSPWPFSASGEKKSASRFSIHQTRPLRPSFITQLSYLGCVPLSTLILHCNGHRSKERYAEYLSPEWTQALFSLFFHFFCPLPFRGPAAQKRQRQDIYRSQCLQGYLRRFRLRYCKGANSAPRFIRSQKRRKREVDRSAPLPDPCDRQ
jgi:hypothetical protein